MWQKNRIRYLAAVSLGSNAASEMCMNFVRTSHEVRTYFTGSAYALHRKCVRSAYVLHRKCVRTSQEVRTHFVQETKQTYSAYNLAVISRFNILLFAAVRVEHSDEYT